jgi:hypothetical protein
MRENNPRQALFEHAKRIVGIGIKSGDGKWKGETK